MIKAALGNLELTLDGRTWACTSAAVQRMLQQFTGQLDIHGGTPDIEFAIFEALAL